MASTSTRNPHPYLARRLTELDLSIGPELFRDTKLYPGDGRTCLPGTREAVLNDIEDWAKDPIGPPFYWLHGAAGTGKTTIARTIAQNEPENGQFRASFFCSRDREQKNRNNPRFIYHVLAVQLEHKYGCSFTSALESKPALSCREEVLMNLITIPLWESGSPNTMIIIDAIDQCQTSQEFFLEFMRTFTNLIRENKCSNLKIFIISRPEEHIFVSFMRQATGYKSKLGPIPLDKRVIGKMVMFSLHGVESYQVKEDIRLFFQHEFLEIERCQNRVPGYWPEDSILDCSSDELDELCELAAGWFFYAKAIVSYIGSDSPIERLEHLLGSPEGTEVLNQEMPWLTEQTICSYYMAILRNIFLKREGRRMLRSVLGAVILAQGPISTRTIGILLGVEDTMHLLSPLWSFLILKENDLVQAFHHSFPKFITDEKLCTKENIYISSHIHHEQLLIACLELMNNKLKQKIEGPRIKSHGLGNSRDYANAIDYACTAWYRHIAHLTGKIQAKNITPHLNLFLQKLWRYWELLTIRVPNAHQDAKNALAEWNKWAEGLDSSLDTFNSVLNLKSSKFCDRLVC